MGATEEWFEERSPGVGGAALRWCLTDHEVFRVGVAATCCLTLAVFLFAVVKLPVRDTLSAAHLPGIRLPASVVVAQQTSSGGPAAAASSPAGVGVAVSAPAAPGSPAPATAAASAVVAPAALPTLAPVEAPAAVATAAPRKPSPAPAASAPTDHAVSNYAVQPGDTLFSIARRHGVSVGAIASLNKLSDVGTLKAGEQLKLP